MLGSKFPVRVQHLHIQICLNILLLVIVLNIVVLVGVLMPMYVALMRLARRFFAGEFGEWLNWIRIVLLWLKPILGHHTCRL